MSLKYAHKYIQAVLMIMVLPLLPSTDVTEVTLPAYPNHQLEVTSITGNFSLKKRPEIGYLTNLEKLTAGGVTSFLQLENNNIDEAPIAVVSTAQDIATDFFGEIPEKIPSQCRITFTDGYFHYKLAISGPNESDNTVVVYLTQLQGNSPTSLLRLDSVVNANAGASTGAK